MLHFAPLDEGDEKLWILPSRLRSGWMIADAGTRFISAAWWKERGQLAHAFVGTLHQDGVES